MAKAKERVVDVEPIDPGRRRSPKAMARENMEDVAQAPRIQDTTPMLGVAVMLQEATSISLANSGRSSAAFSLTTYNILILKHTQKTVI